MPDLDWVTIAEVRRGEVEALTEQVEGLQAEVARLRGLLNHQHQAIARAHDASDNVMLYARDGGVNPS
jgi:hypothetical protein